MTAPCNSEGPPGACLFEYRTATRAEISTVAQTLVGKRLIDFDPTAPMVPSSARNKGAVGKVYETAFGIEPNSVAGGTFPAPASNSSPYRFNS